MKPRSRSLTVAPCALVALSIATAGCQAQSDWHSPSPIESRQQAVKADIDVRRSLVVTEHAVLARFPFQRVMDQLVAQSGVPGLTSLALFQQWWGTQNPTPAGGCTGALNDYPYLCRPAATDEEGAESAADPFASPGTNLGEYIPIGLFNRFDLAPANGANCGEHRIVYARRSGIDVPPAPGVNQTRNLIIFEATLPNPHPNQGLKGCKNIVKFWADLSSEDDIEERADQLEAFYFQGIASVPPVVNVAHFGDNATGVGQIRTNQFLQANPAVTPKLWNLREYKLLRSCAAGTCSAMTVVPVTDKTNPFGPLFAFGGSHSQTAAFQGHFLTQVPALAAGTLAGIDFKVPDQFNTGQSLASALTIENNYVAQLALGTAPDQFKVDIQSVLTGLGSALTPEQIVGRAQAMSCAGCHRLNANPAAPGVPGIGGGLVWPASLGFTHVTEQQSEPGDGDDRFRISPALVNDFLPVRKQVLDDFLNNRPPNVNQPSDPIGGRRVH
jgi:hypothetical protein